MAIGSDQRAVEADVAGVEGRHGAQLGGDKIGLRDAVLLIEEVQNGQLHPLGALVVLEGTAAHQEVEALAGDGLAQGLFGLLRPQVGQQVVDGKQGVPRPGADSHLDAGAVLEGDDTVELQGDGHPLVLADAAVVVGLEEGQLGVLI